MEEIKQETAKLQSGLNQVDAAARRLRELGCILKFTDPNEVDFEPINVSKEVTFRSTFR